MTDRDIQPVAPVAPETLSPVSPGAQVSFAHARPRGDPPEAPKAPRSESPPPGSLVDPSRHRLIIEAADGHRFVYKVLDRMTGEVVRQFPREEVLRLRDRPDYDPGQLFVTAV